MLHIFLHVNKSSNAKFHMKHKEIVRFSATEIRRSLFTLPVSIKEKKNAVMRHFVTVSEVETEHTITTTTAARDNRSATNRLRS